VIEPTSGTVNQETIFPVTSVNRSSVRMVFNRTGDGRPDGSIKGAPCLLPKLLDYVAAYDVRTDTGGGCLESVKTEGVAR
jgi:hypothetical protein